VIEGVIFDIGGVLAKDVWEHLLPCHTKNGGIRDKFGLNKEEVHKVGKLLWGAFAHIPEGPKATWRELERRYWDLFINFFWPNSPPPSATIDTFIDMTSDYIVPVDAGMPDLLKYLRARGINLGICSNNNEFWFRRQFSDLGLYQFFSPSRIALSCRVGASKSSKNFEMFHAVIDAMNVHPSKCVFVDDRQENIDRAEAFGLKGVRYESLPQLREGLDAALNG